MDNSASRSYAISIEELSPRSPLPSVFSESHTSSPSPPSQPASTRTVTFESSSQPPPNGRARPPPPYDASDRARAAASWSRRVLRKLSDPFDWLADGGDGLEAEMELLAGRGESAADRARRASLYARRPSLAIKRPRRQWLRLVTLAVIGSTLVYLGARTVLDPEQMGRLPVEFGERFGTNGPLRVLGLGFALGPHGMKDVCAKPYSLEGEIVSEASDPERLRWQPAEADCTPPTLMDQLRKSHPHPASSDTPLQLPLLPQALHKVDLDLPFPWLHRQTILLFGDHVDRSHVRDFCRLAGGQFASISKDHPLSPPPFANGIDERESRHGGDAMEVARPAVCWVKRYDLTLVSVHHWGLANRVEFEWENLYSDPHFYSPVALPDRLHHIVIPLLSKINRPSPSIISLASGLWDLRHFRELDNVLHLSNEAPLTADRLAWYNTRLRAALASLALAFPKTPMLWSTPTHMTHHPLFTPGRIQQLDQEGRKVLEKLQLEQQLARGLPALLEKAAREAIRQLDPARHTGGRAKGSGAGFLNLVKGRIGEQPLAHALVIGDEDEDRAAEAEWGPLGVDEWGRLMKGQDHLFTDPDPHNVPGGFLWGDIILSELELAKLPPWMPPSEGFGFPHPPGHHRPFEQRE